MTGAVYRIDVRVRAPVKDTEVPARVADSITNIFPDADLERRESEIVGETHTLSHFSELLHRQEILDTARAQLHAGRQDPYIEFELKKQAAFQGVINFAVGGPAELGTIDVTIKVTDPDVDSFIDSIAPPTEDGRPIDPASDSS